MNWVSLLQTTVPSSCKNILRFSGFYRAAPERNSSASEIIFSSASKLNFALCTWKREHTFLKKIWNMITLILVYHIFHIIIFFFGGFEKKRWYRTKPDLSSSTGEQIRVMSSITGARRATCLLNSHQCDPDGGEGAQNAALCPNHHSDSVDPKVLTSSAVVRGVMQPHSPRTLEALHCVEGVERVKQQLCKVETMKAPSHTTGGVQCGGWWNIETYVQTG